MIGRVLVGLAVLFSIALLWAGGGLAWAHLELWRLRPPLPDANEIAALGDAPDAPVRLWWWNTSSQAAPRGLALDRGPDPGGGPWVMSHPAFVLEWTNGRRLLIDAGMSRSAAERFAAPIVQAGGTPPVVRESLAERLGAAAGTLAGALFSHLHTDHVEGMGELCKARSGAPLPVFQTPDQARRSNYTTRAGRDLLEAAGCAAPHELPDLALAPVPGFAGVAVVAGAGHTPGSQIVLAALAEGGERRLLAFTGDVANHVDGIRLGVPKPILYRTLMVPESEGRLARLRDWLAELERGGATLLVAHDGLHLETLGIPELPEPAPPTPSALLRVP
jgi:glyoxylase-like metal-dependent hydrolase (beta-lactamase superfamily II)